MKKSLVAVLALGVGLTFASGEKGPTASAEPGIDDAAQETCLDAQTDDKALVAAGFTIVEVAAGGIPACPATRSCGGVNVTCRSQNCSATDTGTRHCRRSNGSVLQCTQNTTIHVTNCGCEELFRAACCNQNPACLCVGCGSGATFVSCQ